VFLLIFGCALLAQGNTGYLLLVLGAVAAAAFYALDKRSRQPMLDLARLKENRDYRGALLGLFVVYAAGFGMTFLFSLYLQLFNGFSPQEAGIVLMISPCVMAVIAPLAGRLADRFSPKPLAAQGAFCVMVSLLMATSISIETPLSFIIAVLVTQGLGFAIFSAPNMSLILHSVEKDQLTMASALSAKMRSLGMVASMAIVTIFLAVMMGTGSITGGDYVHGMMFGYISVLEYSFIVYAGLACCGAFLVVGKLRRPARNAG
jgi:MFS family permease